MTGLFPVSAPPTKRINSEQDQAELEEAQRLEYLARFPLDAIAQGEDSISFSFVDSSPTRKAQALRQTGDSLGGLGENNALLHSTALETPALGQDVDHQAPGGLGESGSLLRSTTRKVYTLRQNVDSQGGLGANGSSLHSTAFNAQALGLMGDSHVLGGLGKTDGGPRLVIARPAICSFDQTADSHAARYAPMYAHQAWPPDGKIAGCKELRVNVDFDDQWRPIRAMETFQECKTESPLKFMEDNLPLLFDSNMDVKPFPGRMVWENEEFVLKYCDLVHVDLKAQVLMQRCHAMSTFFIERASQVDVLDRRWSVYLLCSKKFDALVGFTTMFEFSKPLRGTRIVRVCVALVLPNHQRKGLGDHILRECYRNACVHGDVEYLTVEDPCEGFTKMRQRCEVGMCREAGIFFDTKNDYAWGTVAAFEQIAKPLKEDFLGPIRRQLKIADSELVFCFEAGWLNRLVLDGDVDDERKKKFRLSVKERLRKLRVEELPNSKTNSELFKQKLHELYEEHERALKNALGRRRGL